MDYVIYVADVETTGLDSRLYDIIELSLYRLSDGIQKTWCIKPTNPANFEAAALRINGHKLEDIRHETKAGRDRYLDPSQVLIEIENWMNEDGVPTENRVMCGQNIGFDHDHLKQLWVKCQSSDTFPFGRRLVDTMSISFFLDWCKGEMAEGYSLANLTKRFNVKNEKAHSAEADVKATKEVFLKLVDYFKSKINDSSK